MKDKLMAIFTHNCMQRMVCGRVNSISSRMALDDNQGTTIDGTHKGAGIVRAQSETVHIQYYFAQQSDIEKWFTDRGLTKKGYMPGEDPMESFDPSKLDFGDDEEMTIEHKHTDISFAGKTKSVDFTQDQHFTEV